MLRKLEDTFNLIEKPSAIISILFTSLTAIISLTYFFASLDKRLTVNEAHQVEMESRVDLMDKDLKADNTLQNSYQDEFRSEVHQRLANLETKTDKIISMMIEDQKAEEA